MYKTNLLNTILINTKLAVRRTLSQNRLSPYRHDQKSRKKVNHHRLFLFGFKAAFLVCVYLKPLFLSARLFFQQSNKEKRDGDGFKAALNPITLAAFFLGGGLWWKIFKTSSNLAHQKLIRQTILGAPLPYFWGP